MEEYTLELKQIVDYPRCRMYRQFIHGLISNKNLRVGRDSCLYYYTVLCCYANFRTAYHRVKNVTYTVYSQTSDTKYCIINRFEIQYLTRIIDVCQ